VNRFFPQANSSDDGWFRAGSVDVTTTILMTGLCAVSFLVYAVNTRFLEPFVLIASRVLDGQVWRILTWPLVNEPSIWSVITLAVFYMFGRELERLVGRVRFAWFLAILIVIPGFAATAIGLDVYGLRNVEIAIFLVFVLLYPKVQSFFGIPLWVLGAVFLGISVLQLLGLRAFDELAFLAIILATGMLTMRAFNLGDDYDWIPKVPLPGLITKDPYQKANRAREKAQRSTQRKAPRSGGRGQRKPADVVPIRPEARLDRASQADMDWLLDKISAGGIESLTPEERRRLDDHSRRLRGN